MPHLILQMKELQLRSTMLGDEGLIAMAACIHWVEKLMLEVEDDHGITQVGIKALCRGIQTRDHPVRAVT